MKNGNEVQPPTDSALAAPADSADHHVWEYELVPSKLGKFKKTKLEIINFGPACT